MNERKIIHIRWEGPFDFKDIKCACERYDDKYNRGLYQIYGPHRVYGHQSLLYIGKTEKDTFINRLDKEEYKYVDNNNLMRYFLGRLAGEHKKKEIQALIDIAETMLIVAHQPSNNASKIKVSLDHYCNYIIYNWDNYNLLLPEVSGDRYHSKYWDKEKYPFNYIG
ncbi:MAG TPA: hypothetical protein PK859_08845 [Spirochaetota bacterium]|nr:hypothetical protein [Spirochaetota bacterium]HPR49521.1 hypothetical protein [Spirochaetota bacterium]